MASTDTKFNIKHIMIFGCEFSKQDAQSFDLDKGHWAVKVTFSYGYLKHWCPGLSMIPQSFPFDPKKVFPQWQKSRVSVKGADTLNIRKI